MNQCQPCHQTHSTQPTTTTNQATRTTSTQKIGSYPGNWPTTEKMEEALAKLRIEATTANLLSQPCSTHPCDESPEDLKAMVKEIVKCMTSYQVLRFYNQEFLAATKRVEAVKNTTFYSPILAQAVLNSERREAAFFKNQVDQELYLWNRSEDLPMITE